MEELLQPIVEILEQRLKAKLKGITDPEARENIFDDVIFDICEDIEQTLREMLIEYCNPE